MRSMRRQVGWSMVAALLLVLTAGCGAGTSGSSETKPSAGAPAPAPKADPKPQEPQYISIAANPAGTPAYQWAAGLADILTKKMSIKTTAEETKGYVENVTLIKKNDVEAAFSNSLMAFEAWNANKQVYGWINFADIHMHVFALQKSEVNSLADLAGKRVGLGQPGGTSLLDAEAMLKEAGLLDKVKGFKVTVAEQVDMLKNGQLDAGIWNGSIPVPAIMELAATQKIKLIPVPKDVVDKLSKNYPGYGPRTLPKTYTGVDAAVETFGLQNLLMINGKVPEETVYQMTKVIYENLADLGNVHPVFKKMKKETMIFGMPIPIHPGAAKYYEEIGVPGIKEHQAKFK
jgi:TRAP transporter TAXI family solute receptor